MSGLNTTEDHGLSMYCNVCDMFPNNYNIRATSVDIVVTCGECGETEVLK